MGEWIGHYFKRSEFECRCGCGRDEVHPDLIALLDDVRKNLGVALSISSGVRCVDHNQKVGGVKNSLHLPQGALHVGHAADVTFSSVGVRALPLNLCRLYAILESYGRGYGPIGLGLYGNGRVVGVSGGFVHVDMRGKLGLKSARWDSGFSWPRLN